MQKTTKQNDEKKENLKNGKLFHVQGLENSLLFT